MMKINPDKVKMRCNCVKCDRYVLVSGHDFIEEVHDVLDIWTTLDQLQDLDRHLNVPRNELVCGDCLYDAMEATGAIFDVAFIIPLVQEDMRLHRYTMRGYFRRPVDH